MANKMTLRDYYNELSALVSASVENGVISTAKGNELSTFINGRIEQIAKKNGGTGERKPTKNQIANVELGKRILSVMELNTLYTVSQILKSLNDDSLNQSKISAVIRPMLVKTANGDINPNGTIERTMEKGVAYFRKLDLESIEVESEDED